MQKPRPFPLPLWDGSPLDGKTLLIYMEQGLGDMIQFIRYASLVKERGGKVEATPLPPFDVLRGTWPTRWSFPAFWVQAVQFMAVGADLDVKQSYDPGCTPRIPRTNSVIAPPSVVVEM